MQWGTNPFVWYGTTRSFDTLTLTFRTSEHGVRLLSNLLPFIPPGSLLRDDLDVHSVFKTYWPVAQADSFNPSAPRGSTSR